MEQDYQIGKVVEIDSKRMVRVLAPYDGTYLCPDPKCNCELSDTNIIRYHHESYSTEGFLGLPEYHEDSKAVYKCPNCGLEIMDPLQKVVLIEEKDYLELQAEIQLEAENNLKLLRLAYNTDIKNSLF